MIHTSQRAIPPVAARPDIACKPDDNAFFYPDEDGDKSEAMKLCWRRCPHREDCLNWAVETNQQYGIWGGMTANARSRLRKLTARTAS